MQAIAHEAVLDTLRPEDKKPRHELRTERQHLMSIAHINAAARERLLEPSYPPFIHFLREYYREVAGRCGGANGELTWPGVESWERQSGRTIPFYQKLALFQLDTVRRHPEALPAPAAPIDPTINVRGRVRGAAWPSANRTRQ